MTNEAEERDRAEYEYSISAFDYQKDPVGSRDWTLFWKGWQAARAASPVSAVQHSLEKYGPCLKRLAEDAVAPVSAEQPTQQSELANETYMCLQLNEQVKDLMGMAQKQDGELRSIDAILERRPALSNCKTRAEKIELAISAAGKLDGLLRRYGRHADGCLSRPDCSCGWEQVIEWLRGNVAAPSVASEDSATHPDLDAEETWDGICENASGGESVEQEQNKAGEGFDAPPLRNEPLAVSPEDWMRKAANVIEENLADYARRWFQAFDTYRTAWLREMGGVIRPKSWEIDGFVLRMRDIYEKAKLVDRMKQLMVKKLKEKCTAEEMFDAVFQMLAEDRHDQIPTN